MEPYQVYPPPVPDYNPNAAGFQFPELFAGLFANQGSMPPQAHDDAMVEPPAPSSRGRRAAPRPNVSQIQEEDPEAAERRKELRRETQKRYFAKKKGLLAEQQKQIEEAKEEKNRLLKEQRDLLNHNQALYKLQEYTDSLMQNIKGLVNNATDQVSALTTAVYQEVHEFENYIKNNVLVPSDMQIRRFVYKLDRNLLAYHRERAYLDFRNDLSEWRVTKDPKRRATIEARMERINNIRSRVFNIAAYERPDFFTTYFADKILPPGRDTDTYPGINPRLDPMVDELSVTPSQRAQLTYIWNTYLDDISRARSKVRQAQAAARGCEDCWPDAHEEKTLQKAADGYLVVMQAAMNLSGHAQEEIRAVMKLTASVLQTFTSLQMSMVIMHCHPFVADGVQITDLVLRHRPCTAKITELISGASGTADILPSSGTDTLMLTARSATPSS